MNARQQILHQQQQGQRQRQQQTEHQPQAARYRQQVAEHQRQQQVAERQRQQQVAERQRQQQAEHQRQQQAARQQQMLGASLALAQQRATLAQGHDARSRLLGQQGLARREPLATQGTSAQRARPVTPQGAGVANRAGGEGGRSMGLPNYGAAGMVRATSPFPAAPKNSFAGQRSRPIVTTVAGPALQADDIAEAILAVARLPERAVVPEMQVLPTYL